MSIDNQIGVSIIIPIYNVSKNIERCMDSVLHQTYTNIECVLVDDCTPDDSMDIVNKKQHQSILWSVHEGNLPKEVVTWCLNSSE